MRWWQIWKRDVDLTRELESDLELEEAEQRGRGLPQEHAHYAARRAFGNPVLIREQTHEAWSLAPFERLWQDLRYTFRQLLRTPAFTLTALVIFAFSIGASAAVFSILDSVLMRPYAFQNPSQIVGLPRGRSGGGGGVSLGSRQLPALRVSEITRELDSNAALLETRASQLQLAVIILGSKRDLDYIALQPMLPREWDSNVIKSP